MFYRLPGHGEHTGLKKLKLHKCVFILTHFRDFQEYPCKKNKFKEEKMKFFRKFYNVIALDGELYGTTIKLYTVLLAIADFNTHEVIIYIDSLAKKINRSSNTVRRHLNTLIRLGLVERIFRKSPHNSRMNLANLFIVHDIDAERYANADENSLKFGRGYSQKLTLPTPKNGGQIIQERFLEKKFLEENTLKREANLPKKSNKEFFSNNLENIPDILKTTAEYWLFKTGKKSLSKHETEVLRELLNQHTPVRIQKEIDTAVERFIRDGKDPAKQNFWYIGKALSNQKSYNPEKKVSQTKATEIQPKQEIQIPELSMPVEEAEKTISDYVSNVQEEKKSEDLPVALVELFEKIQAKDKENLDDYLSRKATEVERAKKAKEPERNIEINPTKLEDYLHLKFPEAEEEELHRDYCGRIHEDYSDFPRKHLLQEAFEIDYRCAMCNDSSYCKLPLSYKKNSPTRPVAYMRVNENGDKYLSVDYGECIKCKHASSDKARINYEFEERIKTSGISISQSDKTFETFNHKNVEPEILVAKAQAILAAKNQTNLILAGKPGTGKTHLASAIALAAMKEGRKAIFKSLPELLDEICCAFQNNADPQSLMLKYKRVPCLVLDDWGKEKTTEARLDYLYQIIDYRYRNGLQTILTTNAFNVEGLKNRWNADKIEPLVSRILENGKWVTIYNSENYRLKKSVKPEAEIETKLRPEIQTSRQEIISEELPIVEEASAVEVSSEADISETLSQLKESVRFEDTTGCEAQTQEISSEENHECLTEKSEPPAKETQTKKSWQEISESAEYQTMSEHDKLVAQWKYIKESPEYESMSLYDQIALQIEFGKRIDKATQNKADVSSEFVSKQSGYEINVPQYDDGLDDLFAENEDELKLYGAR